MSAAESFVAESPARRPRLFVALGLPPMAWLAVFFLVPMALPSALSFGQNVTLTRIAVTGSLANYAHTLQPLYLRILAKSLAIAAATTLVCVLAGFPTALAIAFAPARRKPWLLALIMLPFWTNLLVRTFALMAVLRPEGYLNKGLGVLWRLIRAPAAALGFAAPPFHPLALMNTDVAVLIGLVYVNLPFMVLPLYAALERMDRGLIEAAQDLGAPAPRVFARVILPLAMPGVASGVILTLIPALGSYLTPDLLGGPSSLMIANVIERQFHAADDWPFGAALSFVLILLTFVALAARGAMQSRRS